MQYKRATEKNLKWNKLIASDSLFSLFSFIYLYQFMLKPTWLSSFLSSHIVLHCLNVKFQYFFRGVDKSYEWMKRAVILIKNVDNRTGRDLKLIDGTYSKCFRISTFKLTSLLEEKYQKWLWKLQRIPYCIKKLLFSFPFWICWKFDRFFHEKGLVTWSIRYWV